MSHRKRFALLLGWLAAVGGSIAAGPTTVTLDVRDMACQVCQSTVRKALEKVPGVEAAKVDFKSKLAIVTFDSAKTTPEALMKATANAGFPSTLKQAQ